MLTLLCLKSRFENCVKLLSFTCDLVLQRCRENLIVFVSIYIDLLLLAFFDLLYLLTLFFNQVDDYLFMVILLLPSSLLLFFQTFLQFLYLLSFFTRDVLVFIVQNIWYRLLHRQFSSHSTTVAFVFILEKHWPAWVGPVP